MISPINTQHDLIKTKARIPGFKMDLIMIFLRKVGHPCCPCTYRQGDIAVSIDSWHFTLLPFSKERVSILKLLGCLFTHRELKSVAQEVEFFIMTKE